MVNHLAVLAHGAQLAGIAARRFLPGKSRPVLRQAVTDKSMRIGGIAPVDAVGHLVGGRLGAPLVFDASPSAGGLAFAHHVVVHDAAIGETGDDFSRTLDRREHHLVAIDKGAAPYIVVGVQGRSTRNDPAVNHRFQAGQFNGIRRRIG